MPHSPPRNRPARLLRRWAAHQPTDRLTEELAELQATVAALRAELKPLADRVAGLAKSSDAQRRRVDALAAAQERTQDLIRRQDKGSSARAGVWFRELAARLGRLLPGRAPPVEPAAAPPPAPAVDWIMAGSKLAPGTRSVLVVLFGLDATAREVVVQRLKRNGADEAAPLLPVFLTESSDFTPMRRVGAAFEYLPLHDVGRDDAHRRDWELYAVRRFAGVCAKWQPVQVVAFGTLAARQLALWHASPQLPATVKDLLAVTPYSALASP